MERATLSSMHVPRDSVVFFAAFFGALWTGAASLAGRLHYEIPALSPFQELAVLYLPSGLTFAWLYLRVWQRGKDGPAGNTLLIATIVGWLRVVALLLLFGVKEPIPPWVFAAPLIPALGALGKIVHGVGGVRNGGSTAGAGAICIAAGWLVVAAFLLGSIRPWESPELGIENKWNRISERTGAVGELVSAVYVLVLGMRWYSSEAEPVRDL